MEESGKSGPQGNASSVRVAWFPTYRVVRHLLRVWPGRSRAEITKLHGAIMQRTGTPADPADWSDPDTWIPELLSGENRKLAHAIWEGSDKTVNPRHTLGSWELVRHCKLLAEHPDGNMRLTDRGRDFIDHATGRAEALVDEQEGLIGLLTIVGDKGPARTGVLVEPWGKFLLERKSPFRSTSTIKDTLSRRLSNLLDRDLLKKERLDYSITKAGLDYWKRVGPAKAALDAYLAVAHEKREGIYRAERYKEKDLAKALKNARAAVLGDDADWPSLVTKAIKHKDNNIIFHVNKTKLVNWIADDQAKAREALSALWSEGDRLPGDRIRSFDAIVPETVWPRTAIGTRLYCGLVPHDGNRPAPLSAVPAHPFYQDVSAAAVSDAFSQRCRECVRPRHGLPRSPGRGGKQAGNG